MTVQRATVAIAERLVEHGVSTVFGLMGDDTAELASRLPSAGVRFVCARHENSAVAMAVGHGWAVASVGVCLLSRGPGMTNGMTALVDAARGDQGLVVLTGDEPTQRVTRGAGPDHKALDIEAMATAAGWRLVRPSTVEDVVPSLDRAMECARAGQIVVYSVPKDLLVLEVPAPGPVAVVDTAPVVPAEPALATALSLIDGAKRPLILAGRGVWKAGAGDQLVALADRIGAAVATTLLGQGLAGEHRLAAGVIGSFSHTAGRRIFEQADLVIAVGASLNRYTTAHGTALPDVPVVHIDHRAEAIGRYHRADVGVVGDAALVLSALTQRTADRGATAGGFDDPEMVAMLRDFTVDVEFDDESTAQTVDPRVLMRRLDAILPDDRVIVPDVGNAFGFVTPLLTAAAPDRYRIATNFAAIGLGVATATGAALARPGTTTIGVVGDGALLMVLGELETLAREDVPVVVLCLNDHAYGAEKHFLDLSGIPSGQTVFPDADLAAVAEQFGIEAHTIRSLDQLDGLTEVLAAPDGPVLLDCKINPSILAPFLTAH